MEIKLNFLDKILLGAIVGTLFLLIGSVVWNQNLTRERNNWEHNYRVMQDSVELVETKYGEVLYTNGSLIVEKRELEDALGLSQKQVKDYEKKLKSNLAYIGKLESQLKIKDTIKVTEVVHDTLSNSYTMHYKDDWLGFNETFSLANPLKPTLDVYDIVMNVPLKVGVTDNYTIFVTSPNPYFNISEIEGAVIDGGRFNQKQPRWSVGAYAGFGIQYGMINKQLDAGPQVGVGISYRIF